MGPFPKVWLALCRLLSLGSSFQKPFFSHVDALWRNFPCGFCTCMHAHVGTLPHGLHMWTLGPVWAISAVTTLIASFQTLFFTRGRRLGATFPGVLYIYGRPRGHGTSWFTYVDVGPRLAFFPYGKLPNPCFFTCGRRVGATFPGDLYICARPRGHITSWFTYVDVGPRLGFFCSSDPDL